ncbi:MAG: lysylphosphatidylglycerol synthase domain-containing protein, partial [Thermodesulfobacteriota bacterium]|nr:lysylphosphatidylglycerol synthase domain-containing protein [Thermodesulfobacteriota bacterium]
AFRTRRTLKRYIDYFIEIFNTFRSYRSSRSFFVLHFLTLIIWFLIFLFYYLLALSVGLTLSFSSFSLCVLLINLAGLLPVQGIAGLGSFEAAVILGLTNFGIAFDNALSFSVSLHILYVAFFLVFGLIGILLNLTK